MINKAAAYIRKMSDDPEIVEMARKREAELEEEQKRWEEKMRSHRTDE